MCFIKMNAVSMESHLLKIQNAFTIMARARQIPIGLNVNNVVSSKIIS